MDLKSIIFPATASSYSGEEEEGQFSELESELKEMGPIEKEANGTVRLDHFLKLFKLVTKHAKKQIIVGKHKNAKTRREFLASGDENSYKECVAKQMGEEEQIYQEVATFSMESLNIEEQEFMMSQQIHMSNPMFQKAMMEMQMGLDDTTRFTPPITKEKAKEIFKYVEEQKFKTMENMSKNPISPENQ